MTRQIGDEDTVARAESRRERLPVVDRATQSVYEDDRRTVPADRVRQPGPAARELAFLESLWPVFAVRHPRGIFCAQWILLQGGPSDVREADKQGCDLARQRVARGGLFRSRGKE